jgi:hypothetical protein
MGIKIYRDIVFEDPAERSGRDNPIANWPDSLMVGSTPIEEGYGPAPRNRGRSRLFRSVSPRHRFRLPSWSCEFDSRPRSTANALVNVVIVH